MMRLVWMCTVFWAGCSLVLAENKNRLEFSGGFYDMGDSFVMSVDFDKVPVKLKWDGYANVMAAMDLGREDKKVTDKRIQFSLKLADDEVAILRRIWKGFGHCDPGANMTLGSGLSVRGSMIFEGKEHHSFFYFVPPKGNFLAQEANLFPVRFQRSVHGNGIRKEARAEFFKYASEFADRVDGYESAIGHLEQSRKNGLEPDWAQIWKWVEWKSQRDQKFQERRPVSSPEVRKILTAMADHEREKLAFDGGEIPTQEPVVFRLEGIVTLEEFRWGGHGSVSPLFSDTASVRWAVLPEEIKLLVEKFVNGPLRISRVERDFAVHVLFDFRRGNEAEQKRMKFIEDSRLVDFLIGEKPEDRTDQKLSFQVVRIYRIGIDWENGKAGDNAAAVVKEGKDTFVVELKKIEDVWSVTGSHPLDRWYKKHDEDNISSLPKDLK